MSTSRVVRAPRGAELTCKGWQQEAALRCLMNNLDPEVAENPAELVVYGGTGRAVRRIVSDELADAGEEQVHACLAHLRHAQPIGRLSPRSRATSMARS